MENVNHSIRRSGVKSGIIAGIILFIIGGVLLAENFGLFPFMFRRVVFSWPMLLIVIGVINLLYRHAFSGSILISLGVFFIIPRLTHVFPAAFSWVPSNFTSLYWPVLLIIGGILLIIHWMVGPKWHKKGIRHSRKTEYRGQYATEENKFSSVFNDGKHIVLDTVFDGTVVESVFGTITLDLRRACLEKAETYLKVSVVFGGVTVLVPQDWYIVCNMDSVFGGIHDKRTLLDNSDKSQKLIIEGECIFGNAELMN